jgi:hypothetical protein
MAGEGGNATGRAEGRRLPAKGKSWDAGSRDAGRFVGRLPFGVIDPPGDGVDR